MSKYRFETVDGKIAQCGDTVYIEEGGGFVERTVRMIHRNYVDLLSKRGKVIQRGKGECWKEVSK
jgi:hypothetical protein